ncbi:BREX system P-loop protein BrxC [Agrobacterium pusense]|uniref:BREX system P-loop protein BrxC n=1 Tax=Agrobacterium pusense TaxID=648995 RepID=UPI00289D168F|nr:BREX system P-loop protein BrxC [Agrobacterium pusense]
MTVLLKEIFRKPLDRPIEGVIKADDDASLRIELDEYVITKEIEKRLEQFLDAYTNYETANGVWISGFFGSGKSHLLKMLALLLENKQVEGKSALDMFLDKCGDNEILRGDLKRAVAIPSRSLLFNIDQKADVISKTQLDALLSVFQKVFDDMCGYYGKQGYIAQFERDLDSRNLFTPFKEVFQRIADMPWERGREQAVLENENIAKAYAEIKATDAASATDVLSKYRIDYKVSIEDFAMQVKGYIDKQGPEFRLNFFVDEVGQYIDANIKLMTNLQTIAESLNTKCRGRAWIIVTAQQDMNAIVGDMTQRQENDFSKIQARFANRMPLNSADVAEVIQERLLKKTDAGVTVLSDLYHVEVNNFKTLFDFADGSIRLKNFADREHFIRSYPFIPYQYELFQMVIQELSRHNAFEGKHSSVGERSMLGVFQEVAVQIADLPIGDIATFDLMFEGIRATLKSNVQQSIQVAERNLGDDFAVRVLKALFLVKYVRAFKASPRNICILMMEKFDTDLTALKRRVEEALNLLEQNTYIQRHGDLYEFLTDEEKDVEQEIKNVDIDSADIERQLEELIFDGVIGTRKIRYELTGHDYSYARYLDDRLVGRDYELSINVVSPLNDFSANPDAAKMQSLSRDQLVIHLKQDSRFISDLLMYKRTDKYVRQAQTSAMREGMDRIISDKRTQNAARYRDLTTKAASLVSDAKLFVRGEELEVRAEDPRTRTGKAFQTLVDRVYVNLGMLRGIKYEEADVGKYIRSTGEGLFGTEASGLTEAEQEILNFAQANGRTGIRTTVKAILEKFERKPYGWPQNAILANAASLLGRGKLEAKSDSNPLEGENLEKAMKNSHAYGNIVVEPQVEFSQAQIRKAKEFYADFFDRQPASTDAKALGKELADGFASVGRELEAFLSEKATYPFLAALQPVLEAVKVVGGKSSAWYMQDFGSHGDKLLDAKEDVLDPIRKFMGGSQRTIYDEAAAFLRAQANNFSYHGAEQAAAISGYLADPNCFKGASIQQIKENLNRLRIDLETALLKEVSIANAEIADLRSKLEGLTDFNHIGDDERQAVARVFEDALSDIKGATLIAVVREKANAFQSSVYPNLLSRISVAMEEPTSTPFAEAREGPSQFEGAPVSPASSAPKPVPKPRTEFVHRSAIKVPFTKAYIANEQDVDDYVEAMRKSLLSEIASGKRITV